MALTDNLHLVTKELQTFFEVEAASLGLEDVFYGDQQKIPRNPALCIESGEKVREINGAPRRTLVSFKVYLILYHSPITNQESSRETNDAAAEAIEAAIHTNPTLNGLVIHGLISSTEPGYVRKGNTIFNATRLTYEATSQMMLP